MTASELRQNARESLAGKWKKAVIIILYFMAIEFVLGFITGLVEDIPLLSFIVEIATLVISIPLSYGLLASFMKLKRGEEVNYSDFLTIATSSIKRSWSIYGNILLKVLPAFIVLVIALIVFAFSMTYSITSALLTLQSGVAATAGGYGTIAFLAGLVILGVSIYLVPKTLLYALSYNICYDHPELSGKEVVEESARLMKGHRWNLVWLQLTFIGWMILATLSFGIGYLWLIPYMLVAMIAFYESLSKNTNKTVEATVQPEDQGPIVEN